jgi:predicted DNA-binding protein
MEVMRLSQRVGFYLTDLQIKNLKKLSRKTGLTVSEIIRRAIDEHLEKYAGKEKK